MRPRHFSRSADSSSRARRTYPRRDALMNSPQLEPCAEIIKLERPPEMSTDDLRWKEACAIADRLVALLADDAPPCVVDATTRPPRT